MSNTYDDARKVFKELFPLTPIEDGQRFAIVLGLLPPSTDYKNALAWRALVDLYKLEHVKGCDCPLCVRYDALTGKKANPQTSLPIEVA